MRIMGTEDETTASVSYGIAGRPWKTNLDGSAIPFEDRGPEPENPSFKTLGEARAFRDEHYPESKIYSYTLVILIRTDIA